jgi:CRISPR-associated endonuclease Csn1
MELEDLGRALYHLGQRRGFKSNRREGRSGSGSSEAKKEEAERSQIKSSIKSLQSELDANELTLGRRLAFVNPHRVAIRNRKRADIAPIWTARRMYEEEFERIWTTQAFHYPALLTQNFKNRIERLMFKQRDVSAGKPGTCELERKPALPRAPRSSLLAQHFRVVQTVNNLRVDYASEKPMDIETWRAKQNELITTLSTLVFERKSKRSNQPLFGIPFAQLKALLGLSKRAKLNLDDDEANSYLRGNRTNAIMSRAFGTDRWKNMDEQEKIRIVRRWITESSPEKLSRIAKTRWELPHDAAEQLASLEPEEGYAALSHVAMLKLLPHMEKGLTYSEAIKEVYGNVLSNKVEHKYLPPIDDEDSALPRIPNPVVKRALSELRKVVNAVIRKHGRPDRIRIELARDLKRNAEQRERLHENIKLRTRERAAAKKWIEERGERPTDRAMEKILLYRRCKDCVYCTKPLGPCEALFSDSSGIEVEHVLPRRCNDNSFSNRVLAHRACNSTKGDQTPRQRWDPSPEWDEMLKLVRSLKDKALLDRFTISTEEELQAFTNRHLSDTRYISKLATEYVELLYGGRDVAIPWEDRNRRCVYASSGALTAEIRKRWGLQAVLNPSAERTNPFTLDPSAEKCT